MQRRNKRLVCPGRALRRVALLMLALAPAAALAQIDPDAPGGFSSPSLSAPPAATTPPIMILPNGTSPAATPAAPVEALKPSSVFITDDELLKINDAIAAYKRMKESQSANAESQAKNFLNQLEDLKGNALEEKQDEPFTYPQFFLENLAYRTPEDWVVQISGQKLSPRISDAGTGLKVISIDKEKVLIEWHPLKMDKVLEVWDNTFNDLTGNNSEVLVDREHNTVTFELRPNQTFSSYVMRVLEGKVRPVTIEPEPLATKEESKAPVRTAGPVDKAKTPDSPPAPEDDKKEGLSGLAETYKKVGLGEGK